MTLNLLYTLLIMGSLSLLLIIGFGIFFSLDGKAREARFRWMLLQDRLDEREFRREGRQMWREIRADQRDANVLLRMLRERQDGGGKNPGEAGAT